MILNRADLLYYLECDKIALKIPSEKRKPHLLDYIWKYEILLRKAEFYNNIFLRGGGKGKINTLLFKWYRFRQLCLGYKLSISIGLNVFGPGLSIAHAGTIVVNNNARIGANCRIHEGVTIGATNGKNESAIIGDNCFIGSGAKIIGSLKIANNVAIGAGAVVVKDILEEGVAVAGVPAKVVSHNGSDNNIIKATELVS